MDLRAATLFIEGKLFDWEWDNQRRLTMSEARAIVHDAFVLFCSRKGRVGHEADEAKLRNVLLVTRGYIIGLRLARPRMRVLPLPDPAPTSPAQMGGV